MQRELYFFSYLLTSDVLKTDFEEGTPMDV